MLRDEAVTSPGRTSKAATDTRQQPVSRAGTGLEPPRHRRRGPPRHRPGRGPARRRHRRRGPARPRRGRPPAPPWCCCACRTARSRPRPRLIRPARSSATAPARPASTCSAPHEAFSLHPLMTVPDGGGARGLRRRRRRGRRAHAARAGDRGRALAERARACAPPRSPTRTASPTTRPPRSRRTSSSTLRGRRRAARRHGRRRARAARAARRAPPSRTGRASGAERALTGPIARGDEDDRRAPARGGRGAHARAARRCSTRWSGRRGSWPRDEDDPHDRRDREPPAARRAPPAARSGSSRRWAPSTPATTR